MAVKIVTDSSADLPAELAEELGITVVPLYVRFGTQVYRDRIDITEDEFYQRLQDDPIHPSTTQPSPQDFIDAYQKLAPGADGIVSIHISSKLSGTCNSAIQAKAMVANEPPIEVIDSQTLTMCLMEIGSHTNSVCNASLLVLHNLGQEKVWFLSRLP